MASSAPHCTPHIHHTQMATAVWLTCGNSLICCTAATHWAQTMLGVAAEWISEHSKLLQIQSFPCSPFWVVTMTAVRKAFLGNSGLPASSFLSRSALAQLVFTRPPKH